MPRGNRPFNPKLKDLQTALSVKSRRLEGDFRVGNATTAVMLWLVEGAIQDDKGSAQPLLIIDLKSSAESLWNQGESGTGTGDPKK
jgi:hypothetical protein